jgi:hypothetical protein
MADNTASITTTKVPSEIGQKPSPFSGRMEDTNWFITECTLFFTLNPERYESEEKKIAFILLLLKTGLAKTWAESYILGRGEIADNGLGLFNNFITLFRGAFTSQHESEDAQYKLEGCKQGNKSINDFFQEFDVLV